MRPIVKTFVAGIMALSFANAAVAADCAAGVQTALSTQQSNFIGATSSLAQQNFSQRPGPFATTTCLSNLMTQSGLDIFFKPPSLDSILGMVQNLACQQAGSIFSSLIGGSAVNTSTALAPGEILSGINIGGNLLSTLTGTPTTTTPPTTVGGFLMTLLGGGSMPTATSTSTVNNSLDSVFGK